MKITPRRGHYLGIVVNRDRNPDVVTTITVDPNDKASVVGAFGELLKATRSSPFLVADDGPGDGRAMIIAQVVARDPHIEVLVAEARSKEQSGNEYEAAEGKQMLDEFERNGVHIGQRYAVQAGYKVGEDEGRSLVLFTSQDIIAHVDPE